MRGTWAIAKREFKNYFISPMGYIYLVVFLFLTSFFFLQGFFIVNQASIRVYLNLFPLMFILFIPAVTMRLWAEERKLRTIEVLFTLPVKTHEVLLGKFFASCGFLLVSLLLTLPLPLSISLIGSPDWGQIFGGYIGAFLLGASYIALGLFASSITDSQIVAFIIGVVFSFILFIIGEDVLLSTLPGIIQPFFQYVGLGYHFDSMMRGVIDSRDIVYYLSFITFFLYLNLKTIELKR